MDGARNMNKYDTMLAVNKKRNKRKIDTAKKEIYKMLENGEKVMAICKIPLLIKDIACPARSVK